MIRKQVINNRETHILTGFNMTHIMKPHKNNQLTHKQFYDVSVSEPKIYVTDNIIYDRKIITSLLTAGSP